jgi:arabinogalactan oligomer/maltooligosaccharide transport system permease protein
MSTTSAPMSRPPSLARAAAPPSRPAATRRFFTRPSTLGRWFSDLGWRHLVGVLAVLYAGFPLVYVVSASLADGGTLTGSNDLFASVSGANYVALGGTRFWTWMGNTLVVAVATGIGTVLMGAAAAYAFSRFRFSGRRVGLTALLVIQMFPQMLAFVAIFLLLISLGNVVPVLGLDSKLSLICVYLGGALGVNTFLMYGFFNTVPREIDEAAKIDGASHAQIYWTIVLRLTAPILAVVGLLSFISTFGEFIIARVLLQSEESWTLAVGLYGWVSSLQDANWGLFTAGAVVSAVPVLALFLFLQKYIVGGLTAGSVKG